MPHLSDFASLAQPRATGWPRTVVGLLLNDPAALPLIGDAVDQPPYKGAPKKPVLYIKPANTYAAPGTDVVLPADITEVQVGACLGIQIGQTATRLNRDNALDVVAGYRLVADLTVPHGVFYRPAIKQKCRDGFCPLGDVIPRSAVANPDDLTLTVDIDGAAPWTTTTANRVRDVRQALVDVTEFMSLHPGDVLLLGIPAQPPLARAGQSYRISAPGFATLSNRLIAG